MEKSHKIYNLIFDFLLAAGVCFYNDLRFMRFWFLGGQLYHLLFTGAGAVFLYISYWFLYLTGAWSAIAILTLLLVASKKFRPAPLPSTPSL